MASSTTPPPSSSALAAFNLTGTLTPLSSGMGTSYLLSNPTTSTPLAVLKPATPPWSPQSTVLLAETLWSNALLAHLCKSPSNAFRLPVPIPCIDDETCFVVDGWTAATFIRGHDVYSSTLRSNLPPHCWSRIVAASRAFHGLLRDEPKPKFMEQRCHLWAVADRAAWGERSISGLERAETAASGEKAAAEAVEVNPLLMPALKRLWALRREFRAGEEPRSQVVHGDLSGNVLLLCEEGGEEEPGIIDFTPYWRPVRSAEAVLLADAMIDFGLGRGLVEELGFEDELGMQMLVRAVVFRLLAHSGLREDQGKRVSEEEVAEFESAVEVLEGLTERSGSVDS